MHVNDTSWPEAQGVVQRMGLQFDAELEGGDVKEYGAVQGGGVQA